MASLARAQNDWSKHWIAGGCLSYSLILSGISFRQEVRLLLGLFEYSPAYNTASYLVVLATTTLLTILPLLPSSHQRSKAFTLSPIK